MRITEEVEKLKTKESLTCWNLSKHAVRRWEGMQLPLRPGLA